MSITVTRELNDAVKNLPEMDSLADMMVWTGYGGQGIDSYTVGRALVLQALSRDCETALSGLADFFARDQLRFTEICLLGGISVEERIDIGHGMFLCPPDDVPIEAFQKKHVEASNSFFNFELRKFDFAEKRVAGAALIRPDGLHAKLFDPAQAPVFDPDFMRTGFAIQLLTLLGPSSPIVYRQFCEFDDEEFFFKGVIAQAYSWALEETRVSKHVPVQAHDFDGFADLVSKFENLPEQVRAHLFVSIHRLNESVRHTSEVDKALDLGIALESLLLSGKKEKDQLSLQFRLRGTWLLGEDGRQRTELYRQFQQLYDLRSMAAHTGMVSLAKGSVGDSLANGQRLCASAIKRVIQEGGYPDWAALIVGADYSLETE